MSAVDIPGNPPVFQQRQRYQSPVIIDVDAFDADDIVYIGSAHPSRRSIEEDEEDVTVTSEVIHVADSEDDNEIQFVGRIPSPPSPIRRARIFSPPPRPQVGPIPPVPQVPQRFLRQRPAPGLIIPNEEPFPFEANLRPAPPNEQPFPLAAAPPHHIPAMSFGGALLAGVRRIMAPRNTPQLLERRNSWGISGSFIMRWDPLDFAGGEDALFDRLDEIGFLDEEDNPFGAGRVRSQIERAFKQRGEAPPEPDYKPEFTHPDQPSPRFIHDFSPSSLSSSTAENDTSAIRLASGSGSRCEATLVCVACRDPLVLGGSDVGEDRARRKLWGLRCGHLLDGKCIEKLMKPAPPTPDAAGSSSPRKASTEPGYPLSSSQEMVIVDSDAGSMRSRLRPRRGTSMSVLPSVRHPLPATSPSWRPGGHVRTSHRSNRKGKGKMKVPVIDAEYEWSCPVGGCGGAHLSLLVDGRWTMDEKRGAISVFV